MNCISALLLQKTHQLDQPSVIMDEVIGKNIFPPLVV
jgi:phosphatidylglycerophosphatase A